MIFFFKHGGRWFGQLRVKLCLKIIHLVVIYFSPIEQEFENIVHYDSSFYTLTKDFCVINVLALLLF